jgi:subtilase family serine protease
MIRSFRPVAVVSLMLMTAACSGYSGSTAFPQPATLPNSRGDAASFFVSDYQQPANVRAACGGPAPAGYARCIALVRTDGVGAYLTANSSGYGPADLQAAYALPASTGGKGQTVAIVDAMNDPTALTDLALYRSTFHLSACTTVSHCFTKVNQLGNPNGPYPHNDAGWAQEISLDLDMVSAICPNCHIVLVEANSASFSDLAASVDTAARLGANAISNSYGGSEFSGEVAAQSHYNHPGVMITASSGDSGFGPQFPAASQYVTAVGGTTLSRVGSTFSESVWSGAGSGCSAYVQKPTWQTDTGCRRRTIADVSAVADPNTGVVVVYNRGYFIFGGTSVSSPIIASVYALAGNTRLALYGSFPYRHIFGLHDVKGGSNGHCAPPYLCQGVTGYDGPSGLGTPRGVSGF